MSMTRGQSALSVVNFVKYSTPWHSMNHFVMKSGFTVYIANNYAHCVPINALNTLK